MSDTISCPSCGGIDVPALQVQSIAICHQCGSSVVVYPDGQTSRAQLKDLDQLTPGDRARLTRARSTIARPKKL
jgi:uncharacterized paraquat-inducible protein A